MQKEGVVMLEDTVEMDDLRAKMRRAYVLISQSMHDFLGYGYVTDIEKFNSLLGDYSAVSRKYTRLWQEQRGIKQ